MKNSQKGFAIPLIIAIGALLAIGGGYLYVSKKSVNQSATTPEAITTPITQTNIATPEPTIRSSAQINITDWKTYSNIQYAFTIKYPPNWKVMDSVKGGPIVAFAPLDYVFRDGTDTPYGYFIISIFGNNITSEFKAELLKKPLDSGWLKNDFGTSRSIITNDHRLNIFMSGGDNVKLRSIEDKMLESFHL